LLAIPGVGRGRFGKLVNRFGSPKAVFSATLEQLEAVSGITRALASTILSEHDISAARETAARVVQLGWEALYQDSGEYPPGLATIAGAPPLLFRSGLSTPADDRMIAIVGTRHATEAGRRFAHRLAADLAREGVTVVSGMAEGIDSAAHRGALEAGGRTVAVWGMPIDRVYPPSNRTLAEEIKRNGTLYSEYPPGTEPSPAYFPERNRIISGLSEGVVVVEAGEKSGALITARCAREQGRDVFAVPGSPQSANHIGCNSLLKSGARLLTGAADIFEEIPRLRGQVTARRFRRREDLTENERGIVDLLSEGPRQLDQMSRDSGLTVSELLEFLLALELRGVVEELSGKRFALTE